MIWLPVVTLPDGTIIEMPMPLPKDTGQVGVHRYRARGSKGVTEFATLVELLDRVLDPGSPHLEDPLTITSAAAASASRLESRPHQQPPYVGPSVA